jgi:outer membrane protein
MNKPNKHVLIAAAAIAALFSTLPAVADDDYDAYNNNVRLGVYSVFYHTSATDLQGPYVPAGVNFKAKDLETLYFAYIRRLSSAFDVELAGGYPPLSKLEGRGLASVGSVSYNGQVIGSARWLSPTLFLEYKFLPESSKLRPYIGVGVNYTAFYDRDSNAQGNAANGGPTKLSLTSSVGPAGTVGLSYHISGHWHMYASYSIARVNTDLTTDTAGIERTAHIKFGPQALVVSGGYSF